MTELLNQIVEIAESAGEKIMEIYQRSDFNVELKGDGSPLTLADKNAHQLIEAELLRLTPDIPLLSEESPSDVLNKRLGWSRFWLVDPLDGTKEFVKRNGEFTVNIALIEDGKPIMGVVHTPVKKINHFAQTGIGAFKSTRDQNPKQIAVRSLVRNQVKMVTSRSHSGNAVETYRDNLSKLVGTVETVGMGSSLKLCLVAEGAADIYPRLGPTSEWDTAAAHCVLETAGGKVTRLDGSSLKYNKENILNPWFLACGDPNFDWTEPSLEIAEPI